MFEANLTNGHVNQNIPYIFTIDISMRLLGKECYYVIGAAPAPLKMVWMCGVVPLRSSYSL